MQNHPETLPDNNVIGAVKVIRDDAARSIIVTASHVPNIDPRLSDVIDVWPSLSEAARNELHRLAVGCRLNRGHKDAPEGVVWTEDDSIQFPMED